jgi:Carboxypeptidase regulatory-like domain/Calcineurin-like phosphoesterase
VVEQRRESSADTSTGSAASVARSRSPGRTLPTLAGVLVLLAASVTGSVVTATTAHASPATQMTLAVIGDYGCLALTCVENATQAEPQVANLVHSWSPDAILTVGDNSYDNGTTAEIQADQQPYAADISAGRFYPVAGIHDWGQQCINSTYIQSSTAYFGRPAHYVAHLGGGLLDYFATDMNCADPDGDVAGSVQANQYLSNVSASTAIWKITGAHSPPYSSGVAFGSQAFTHWAIAPQIDLFMSGHDHDMEHLVEGGQNFIVDGASGEDTTPLKSPPISGSVWGDGSDFGAVRLTVTQYSLKVDFVNLSNLVLHSFTLSKGSPPAAGTVTGTVTDNGTGQPIQGATVSYSGGIATTDAAGAYRLANVPPGTYSATATAPGYVPANHAVVVSSGTNTTSNFALAHAPPLSLSGQVTDVNTGKALSGAAVSYSEGSTTSDSGGNYSFSNVNAGSYQLAVSASGYQNQSRTVTVGPGYLQGALASAGSGSGSGATSVSVSLPNAVSANDRVVVGVRVDSNPNGAVVQAVSDSAGNVYTKHVTASNNRPSGYQAEVTIWSAVVSAGAGSKLTVTASATASADISIGVAEYSGLSTVSGAGAVDQTAGAGGVSASGPASGATAATTNSNELAVGVYGDGGSGVLITAGAGWSQRFNNSANNQGTIALEDQVVQLASGTPNSQWSNASPNSWAVAEAVFKAR